MRIDLRTDEEVARLQQEADEQAAAVGMTAPKISYFYAIIKKGGTKELCDFEFHELMAVIEAYLESPRGSCLQCFLSEALRVDSRMKWNPLPFIAELYAYDGPNRRDVLSAAELIDRVGVIAIAECEANKAQVDTAEVLRRMAYEATKAGF